TLQFQLLYRRELFSEPRMEEFVAQFGTLVDQAIADPDGRVDRYSLVTPSAARILPSLTATADAPCGSPIHGRVRSHAHARPGLAALIDGTEALTYAELNARSDRFARDLIVRGVRPGDVVPVPRSSAAAFLTGLL